MAFNHRLNNIQGSSTLALNDKAQQLIKQGKDLIHLGIGEPLNPCPGLAVKYGIEKLKTGQVKYGPTSGNRDLKEQIQLYTKTHYGRTPKLDQMIVTMGAKQSLANLLYTLLNPGDEVILLAPYWVSYPEMVKLAGGTPIVVQPEANLVPDLKAIKSAVSPATKTIILNSPNNPTGVVYPPQLIAAVVDFCETEGIYLIMDDIYHLLVFDEHSWVPGYVFTNQSVQDSQLIVVNGVSKTFGMTGFRIGWTIAPSNIIQAMNTIQGHTTSGASPLLQEAARGALIGGEEGIRSLQQLITQNREIITSGLKELPGVKTVEPGGAFYCFPDFSEHNQDSTQLAEFLLEKAYLITIPGSAFGREGHLRLSYTCSPDQLRESIRRLQWALNRAAPNTFQIGDQKLTADWKRL